MFGTRLYTIFFGVRDVKISRHEMLYLLKCFGVSKIKNNEFRGRGHFPKSSLLVEVDPPYKEGPYSYYAFLCFCSMVAVEMLLIFRN